MNVNDLQLIRRLCCLAAILGATFLAYHKRKGWGWLVFIAILLV